MNKSSTYGLIAGVLILSGYLLFYFINPAFLYRPVLFLLSFIPVIFLQWKSTEDCPDLDKQEFRSWVKHPFMVYFISSVMYWILFVSLLKSDASLGAIWLEESTRWHSSNIIAPEDQVDPTLLTELPGMRQWIFRFIFGLVGGFILSSLIVQIKRRS